MTRVCLRVSKKWVKFSAVSQVEQHRSHSPDDEGFKSSTCIHLTLDCSRDCSSHRSDLVSPGDVSKLLQPAMAAL